MYYYFSIGVQTGHLKWHFQLFYFLRVDWKRLIMIKEYENKRLFRLINWLWDIL